MTRTAGTDAALEMYGVKTADALDKAWAVGTAALGLTTLALGGVAIHDTYKGRGFDKHWKKLDTYFADKKGRRIDVKEYVAKVDPKTQVLTTVADIEAMAKREFKNKDKHFRRALVSALSSVIYEDGGNAMMLPGVHAQYVISRPKELPEVIDHELGHAADYREKKLTHKNQGPYKETFMGSLWRPTYDKQTMAPELEAWRRAPDSPHKRKFEEHALGTYDKSFYQNRAGLAASAAFLLAPVAALGFTAKLAEVTTPLQPHQQRVVDRLMKPDQSGIVAMHGLGSGKTLTSIAAADTLGMPADVVLPAALRANYEKELAKHAPVDAPKTNIQSLEGVARNQTRLQNPFLIVDEAHRSRNPTKTQRALQNTAAKKRLLLTGSLFYNQPSDAAAPVNLVAGGTVLPSDSNEFQRAFVREQVYNPGFLGKIMGRKPSVTYDVNPRRKKYLQDVLNKYVDYHPGSTTDFPTRTDETINVPMAKRQKQIYDTLVGNAPKWVHERVVSGLPPKKSEVAQLNRFLQGTRQVSNSTAPYHLDRPPDQPKIDRAVSELQQLLNANPQAKALVYSNYLDAGINPYKSKLDELKIPYGEFTGAMPRKRRDQMVRDYNDNKLKALLLSRAGGEGLDLKGTRMIQLMEPHWNEETLKQVVGRGIRYQSHSHLPEDQRNVRVQHYVTENPRQTLLHRLHLKKPDPSVDQYLMGLSKQKEELNQKFRDLLTDRTAA